MEPAIDPLEQPKDSKAELDEREDGISIFLPARGVFCKGSRFMIFFGVVMSTAAVFMLIAIAKDVNADNRWVGLLVASIFVLVGLAVLAYGVSIGKRVSIIDVVGDSLLITQQSPFGTKQLEWHRSELEDIQFGKSNTKINNEYLMCMQIRKKGDLMPRSFFTAREDDELVWLVATIRKALRFGPKYAEENDEPRSTNEN